MQEICKPKWVVGKEMRCWPGKVSWKTIDLVGKWIKGEGIVLPIFLL
jgi:hypothetical protein